MTFVSQLTILFIVCLQQQQDQRTGDTQTEKVCSFFAFSAPVTDFLKER